MASILLAFSIDAWWDGHQERQEEERLLIALLDEFRENKEVLEEARIHHRGLEQAELELMALAAGSSPDISPDSLDQLIGVILWWWSGTKFSVGALNSVVLGGKLHLIPNEELRREVAGWQAEIESTHFVERQDYTTFHEDFIPYLRENAYLAQISSQTTYRPGSTEPIPNLAVPLRPERADHHRMLRDPVFQNLLVQRWWVQWDALTTYDDFEQRIDEVIAQLEMELGLSVQGTS
ncbi:hypothetical protein ACFL5A_02865 [Gemmatimonadota bacterium]